ncbi:sensor histidine kinase [Kitasatospora sp. NPDC101183]|uniref:sensor histidine kinase n=1 Tax=Kitasatospora sp. NPDC101183 TaxID=3364100 RepID=UPI0038161E67
MIKGIRPLLRGSTYAGVLFALCGAVGSLVVQPIALLPAVMWPSAPEWAQIGLVLVLWAVLLAAVGQARVTRRIAVASARRLLGVPLPDPLRAGAGRDGRWRTSGFLVLHTAVGWAVALGGGVLLILGLALPLGDRFGGRGRISLFGRDVWEQGGWQNWVAGACCLLLGVGVCATATKVLRWAAPALLGPSPAERLALADERERRLAERNRLAHELHDSIGHTLTAATIQAAVAGEVLAADPAAARAAMRSIEESTRAALEDLDHVLGVLREEAAGAAPAAPARTLADLPELLDRLRHAGASVEPQLSGGWEQVPGTLSRAAYRILQEGLTNALRHGGGGAIRLRVVAGAEALELEVVNVLGGGGEVGGSGGRGRAGGFPTSGHGLPGLSERVRLLNGEVEAGPDGPQHWRLCVRLPVRSVAV